MKAVLFDVYETLLTGRRSPSPNSVIRQVAGSFGIPPEECTDIHSSLQVEIQRVHTESNDPHPEVDIRECWKRLFPELADPDAFAEAVERAIHPVHVIPGAVAAITDFHRSGCALGIVSNAQAYTRVMLEEYLGDAWDYFDPELCSFSYESRIAKPDLRLFQRPLEVLESRGIRAADVLMIGDSFRNDIVPARRLGMQTHHLNFWAR